MKSNIRRCERVFILGCLIWGFSVQANNTFEWNAFGDLGARATSEPDANPGFAAGKLSLFFTAQPTASFLLLSETGFEFTTENETELHLARLVATYRFSDAFNVSLGKFHQALGYYNSTYHHGSVFELTVHRPPSIDFEEEGGLLPVEITGLEISGSLPTGPLELGYALNIGNGRGPTPGEILPARDLNIEKSVNLLLYLNWEALGLRAGGNYVFDRIPVLLDEAGNAVRLSTWERIIGAHLLFQRWKLTVLTEAYWIEHRLPGALSVWTAAGFVEADYAIARVRPYFRLDWQDAPDTGSPYYGVDRAFDDRAIATAGVRFEVSTRIVFKLQYERTQPLTGAGFHGGDFQVAFAF